MKLQMFKDIKGKWRCRLVFKNGCIFMSSEAYSSKQAARDSCRTFMREAGKIYRAEIEGEKKHRFIY